MDLQRRSELLDRLVPAMYAAGRLVMAIYGTDFKVSGKDDDSPVTEADRQAERLLEQVLNELTPDIPVVGEEAVSSGHCPDIGERFWLVDPLDGTREFISRNGEFTVNVALIESGRPVLGLVLAPALGRLYAGGEGIGSWVEENGVRLALACRPVPDEGLTVVASRSHGDAEALKAFLGDRKVASSVMAGSSLKLCLVAAGMADVYPRLGRTMEWDTAAGHAVLSAAGGRVVCIDGQPLTYGKPGLDNPHFVAWGLPSAA